MRPNIQISHALNGRVKDYAEQHDISLGEAYQRIIEAGVDALEPEKTGEESDGTENTFAKKETSDNKRSLENW